MCLYKMVFERFQDQDVVKELGIVRPFTLVLKIGKCILCDCYPMIQSLIVFAYAAV